MGKLRHGATHREPYSGNGARGETEAGPHRLPPNFPSSKRCVEDEGRIIESFPPESWLQEDALWRALLAPQDLAVAEEGSRLSGRARQPVCAAVCTGLPVCLLCAWEGLRQRDRHSV